MTEDCVDCTDEQCCCCRMGPCISCGSFAYGDYCAHCEPYDDDLDDGDDDGR